MRRSTRRIGTERFTPGVPEDLVPHGNRAGDDRQDADQSRRGDSERGRVQAQRGVQEPAKQATGGHGHRQGGPVPVPSHQGQGQVAFLVGELADAEVALGPGGHADQGDQPVAEHQPRRSSPTK